MIDEPDVHEAGRAPRKGEGVERLRAVWRRRKWLMILVFALPFAAAATLALSLPNIYKSTATVLVERQQVPEAFVQPTVTSELEIRLHTISQEILSRSRLEGLINRFGLHGDLRTRLSSEEVVEQMRQDIKLELKMSDKKGQTVATTAFALSYRGRDPRTVALVTNTLASFYIEENLKVRERQATGTAEFLEVQLAATKKRLDEQESRVSAFRKRYVGELPQQMQANLAALETLNTQFRLNSDNQIRAAERRNALKAQLADALSFGPELSGPSGLDPRVARFQRLKEALTNARSRYFEHHPTITRLKEEIGAIEQDLAQAPPALSTEDAPGSPVQRTPYVLRLRESLQKEVAEAKILKAEEGRLRRAIASYQARVENTPKREQEYQEFTRDYETTKEQYDSLGKRYGEAQLAESMEQRQKGEQFRVLDPAIPSTKPAAPNRSWLLLASLALSLGLATGAGVVAEVLDSSFHSLGELRAFTPVPVLACIPRIFTRADRRREHRLFRLATAGALLCLVVAAGASYFIARGNESLVQILARDRT